jgi:Skp family chaperone for outer membrane proteins
LKSTIIKSLLLAAVAVMMPFAGQTAQAQEGLVVVLDVAKVFKENAAFTNKMANIKSEADRLKKQITEQQEAIKLRAQALGDLVAGSPERNQLEADLELQQATLRTEARQAETQLLNREANIYHDTYIEMQSVVESLASQNGISLVLRFDSEEIDQNNRAEVIKGVNRAVVYNKNLDITSMVSKAMQTRSAQAPNGIQTK